MAVETIVVSIATVNIETMTDAMTHERRAFETGGNSDLRATIDRTPRGEATRWRGIERETTVQVAVSHSAFSVPECSSMIFAQRRSARLA
jgi:hypothetical protein